MTVLRFGRAEQIRLFRALFAIWLLSYTFHAFQYSVFSLAQLEAFGFLGGLDEARRMEASIHYKAAANAFGEHAVVMFFFFIIVSVSLLLLFLGQALALVGLVKLPMLSGIFLASTVLVFATCTFVLFSEDFTMFFGDDPRTSGGNVWLKLMLYSIGWPILAVVCIDSLANQDKYARKHK